ncbi:hypothetical protein MNBD_GAMMA03-2048 [hydrothermal vent metagenome]|uniref:Ice-binding protein C-terminal domain-containing protein n=1 Tax=hydrothermal vent metagenome TaxID=652676 RepID=A0A3B0W720_9ZZZZ
MKKLVLTKKVGFAASLLLASSLASANVYNLGDLTNGSVDTDTQAGLAGAFIDVFSFSLTEESFFNALATSSIASISEFTGISLAGYNGTTYDIAGIFSVAELTESSVGSPVSLDAGSYILSISGVASADSTGYTLSTVSPVPEPSAIALMLGGLGLVGFMAARRRNQNA